MFEVVKNPLGRFDCYRLVNKQTNEYIEILSDFGAGINDLSIQGSTGSLLSVVNGYRSEEEVRLNHHSKFAGSKLSPFPNRMYDGKYEFEGKEYQLPINDVGGNTNLHAFLHTRPFEVTGKGSDDKSANLKLTHEYKGVDQGYPFPYQIDIEFIYSESGIVITTQVENLGDTSMPLGDGWHPYFQFESLNEVQMKIGGAKRISSLTGNSLSDVHGFEDSKIIGETKLDDCFEVIQESSQLEVNLSDESSGIDLTIWQDCLEGQYKYFQIYTPDNRKEIAVEPVTCPPNAFNSKEGLIVLKPNKKISFKMGIKF